MAQTYRLITRSDFDGLVCANLLIEKGLVDDDIEFVHPKDMQSGKIEVTGRDITANLPYVEGVHLCFDHHASEVTRVGENENLIMNADAPSATRVIYQHYGPDSFPNIGEELIGTVDKSDGAQFSKDEILDPQGWVLLSFIMDARTGLGRFHDFKISNKDLMRKLIGLIGTKSLDEILDDEDVKERIKLYREHANKNIEQLKRLGKIHNNLVVIDLREDDIIWAGNRFMVYAVYPQCNISLHVMWGHRLQNVVFACGKSILERSSQTNIGELMLKYDGGGHLPGRNAKDRAGSERTDPDHHHRRIIAESRCRRSTVSA